MNESLGIVVRLRRLDATPLNLSPGERQACGSVPKTQLVTVAEGPEEMPASECRWTPRDEVEPITEQFEPPQFSAILADLVALSEADGGSPRRAG